MHRVEKRPANRKPDRGFRQGYPHPIRSPSPRHQGPADRRAGGKGEEKVEEDKLKGPDEAFRLKTDSLA